MFDKSLIPEPNPQVKQALTNIYGASGSNTDVKNIIDKKLDKIDTLIKDKINNAVTISEYFNQLWTQPELKEADKEFVIIKLETIQQNKKLQIQSGQQQVSKSVGNLDAINDNFKMSEFEEFNLQEKIEEFKKNKKLDMKVSLNLNSQPDPEVLHALNKFSKSVQNGTSEPLHYTCGFITSEESETIKIIKAEEFVRKLHADKRNFKQSIKEKEKSLERRELEDLERVKRLQKEDEEKRNKEKKDRLEAHIKELKDKNEMRQKEATKWEEDYKVFSAKKPMFKEIETKYKKSTLLPELEERKKKLKEIRDFHKPINRDDILEHERKVMKALEEQEAKRVKSNLNINKKPEFESKAYQSIIMESQKQRGIRENEQQEKVKKRERMMEYLQQVKEKHAPTVDPSKELELLNMIEKLSQKNERSKTADDEERHERSLEMRKKGNDYLLAVKEQIAEAARKKKEKMMKEGENTEMHSSVVEPGKESKLGGLTTIKSDSTFRKKNYLVDLRKENKLQAAPNNIEHILKNKKLDNTEKKELLQTEVEKLEEKAKRLEMLKKHKAKKASEGVEVDDDMEVDQIYINAIKAKLEMLGN